MFGVDVVWFTASLCQLLKLVFEAVGSQDSQRVCGAIVVVETLIGPKAVYGLPEGFYGHLK